MSKFSDVNSTVSVVEPYELVYDINSINKSVKAIILTHIRSRPWRRAFGSTLRSLLFEPMDETTALLIRHNCLEVIEQWETRIQVKTLVVVPDYDDQSYYVELVYIIPAMENMEVTYTFGLSKY